MADFIYLMETRLSPDQQRALALVTDVARAHQMNVYLTGGAVRDIISGFVIRDLDFSVQGNALKLQKDLKRPARSSNPLTKPREPSCCFFPATFVVKSPARAQKNMRSQASPRR